MRTMRCEAILLGLALGAGCGLGVGSGESQVGGDDVGDDRLDDCDGGLHEGGACAGEPDLPYDVEIQCGDPVIPVVAAFREKNGDAVRFAPAPGSSPECPFVIEGATIRAAEVASCAPFVATAEDAQAAGNRDAGRDRVEVTWCWYSDLTAAGGDCCVPPGGEAAVQCETDHLDIRFACDGGEGVADGADRPLEPAATPDACEPGGGGDEGDDDCAGCPENDDEPGDDTGPVE